MLEEFLMTMDGRPALREFLGISVSLDSARGHEHPI